MHAAGIGNNADLGFGQTESWLGSQATARSQAITISKPPPAANPFTAAITGLSQSNRLVIPP